MSANHGDATIFHRLVDDTCNWEANGIPPLSLKCSVREVLFLLTVRPCVGQLSYTISSWAVGQVPLDFWLATATSDKFLAAGLKSRRLALISICYSTTHFWYVNIPHLRQFCDPNWWVSFFGVCLKIWYPLNPLVTSSLSISAIGGSPWLFFTSPCWVYDG
jgi:hypothetical protein